MNLTTKIFLGLAILFGALIAGLSAYAIGSFVAHSIVEVTVSDDTSSALIEIEDESDDVTRTDAPIYFATMTHMEGNSVDDEERVAFERHVDLLRHALSLADEYDAKITVESEQPFARANKIWGTNILQEFIDAGQGVGTHCDINPREDYETQQLIFELRKRKKLVDDLVGAANNRGCSGAGSSGDWASAMIAAGFKYVDGVVGFHYLSMPLSARPSGWNDEYINTTSYHDAAPEDETLRYHPFLVSNADDFVPDEDGRLLVSAGSVGTLQQLAESASEGADYASCAPRCALEMDDVDALVAEIRQIAALHNGSQIGKIDVHIQAEDWDSENDEVLRYFFEEINQLAEEGVVVWATQGEVYDAVVAWQ